VRPAAGVQDAKPAAAARGVKLVEQAAKLEVPLVKRVELPVSVEDWDDWRGELHSAALLRVAWRLRCYTLQVARLRPHSIHAPLPFDNWLLLQALPNCAAVWSQVSIPIDSLR
jgi:hypothetical protein